MKESHERIRDTHSTLSQRPSPDPLVGAGRDHGHHRLYRHQHPQRAPSADHAHWAARREGPRQDQSRAWPRLVPPPRLVGRHSPRTPGHPEHPPRVLGVTHMRTGKYLERLDQAIWLSRTLQLLTLLLTIAVLVLARQKTILHVVPPNLQQEYRIGPSTASREYLSQMASFLTTTALTVNRDNAEYAAHAFLQYLSPEARGRMDTTMLAEAQYIKRTGLTQAGVQRRQHQVSGLRRLERDLRRLLVADLAHHDH